MLIITLGDPYSINIEALTREMTLNPRIDPVVAVGCRWQWRDQCARLGFESPQFIEISSYDEVTVGGLYFYNLDSPEWHQCAEILPSRERGRMAVAALNSLRQLDPNTKRLAVITAPIDKAACAEADFGFPGQTEFFTDLWEGETCMILAGAQLRVGLVTNHHRLADVAGLIDEELVVTKLAVLAGSLQRIYGIKRPRIAVCALNPHAGDHGLFGREDQEIVAPALERFAQENPDCSVKGPLSADTLFYRAATGEFDAVAAMYHDQGLGPVKTLHFDEAINLTAGLRHLRVAPGHGPASDLFLRGRASSKGFVACFRMAQEYLAQDAWAAEHNDD